MKPDKNKEEEVRLQAEQYVAEHFTDDFEVYDTLYDNMGNFGFDYAAKVRDKKSNIEFLVYYDDETAQMVDTYIAKKWANDLKGEIRPYIQENLGESTDIHVYYDDNIGKKMAIDVANPGSYKDFNIAPIIRLTIPRQKSSDDEKRFKDFISFLKSEDKLQQGLVFVAYIAETGEILEDEEWRREF